ncbi:DUF4198 domain-containing protein [Novosphingobium sp. SCN 63-17]|uniref:DUF4198 domain-containing protein n=1 Tax=Novosphingobium sp. SCN 63-17 TaxID=1660120 RepID=UPI00086BCA90|nr:DUF4198 domain-containing protein [Novosphingobium sp. SCN 63-17]ODU81640.1 MAG: nickel uptake transporter family protein [Novosphingobium sp. SCN 63-17]
MLNKTLLLAAGSLAFAVPAQAHDAWFLPSVTVLSDTNQGITVDAAASSVPFVANHAPLNVDAVQVQAPDGTAGKIENVARGRYRSTFDVVIDKPGTWRIGTTMDSVMGRFKVNGEDWMVGRRRGPGGSGGPGAGGPGMGGNRPPMPPAGGPGGPGGEPRRMIDPAHIVASVADIPAGATDLDLSQNQSRNEFFVTAGEPTQTVLQSTGKGLEMVPVTHPDDLVTTEPGKFRFLVDGKPAAGLKVEFVPNAQRFRDGDHAQSVTAGADGEVTVKWPVAGFYWVNASLTDDKPTAPRATKRRMMYTATLEVVAP